MESSGASPAHLRPVAIEPLGAWSAPDLRELWRHRHILSALLRRDLKTRYRQTMLGPLWFVLTPLGRMGVFSVVFGKIAQLPSDGVPYPLFTYAALLPWELFAASVQRSTQSMVKYQGIIPKVYFPRLLIPLAETLSALLDFCCSLLLLLAMMLFYGYWPTDRVVYLPFYVGLALLSGFSVGLVFASLQVRYRDASQLVGYLLQAWSFATPVAYSAALAAQSFSTPAWILYRLNPMFAPADGFRWMFLGVGHGPDWTLPIVTLGVLIAVGASAVLFDRTQDMVVDLL
ncbi:MAG TPA: ABC transporter permease [Terriglobales bacterium]|nr:ABC transporter permease [Terriglobales bacterium]